MTGPWVFPLFAALLLEIAFPRVASPAGSFAPLSAMAKWEAEDHLDPARASTLVDGYLSFGLGREAVSSLERRIRSGEFPRAAAAPLFEKIVADRSVREDPARVAAICETAARNGVGSPPLSVSCGNALRVAGRLAEAADILAGIGADHPYRAQALFALGQISVERGDLGNARELFRGAAQEAGSREDPLSSKAIRAEAGVLLLMGRAAEAAKLLEEFPPGTPGFTERIGTAFAAGDPPSALDHLPAEWISGRPVREKILFLLLKGGIARDQTRFASAIADLTAAEEELAASLSRDSSPPSPVSRRSGTANPVELLVGSLESSRERLASPETWDQEDLVRDRSVELLAGLLVLERYASLAIAAGPGPPSAPAVTGSGEVVSILRRIERIALEGIEQTITALKWDSVFWDIDRFASQLEDRPRGLPPLGHPVQRQRILGRLEGSQAELDRSRERLRRRAEEGARRAAAGSGEGLPAVLRDFGLYLKELEGLRAALADAREFTRANARKARQRNRLEASSRKAMEALAGEALAFARDRTNALLPSFRRLEERMRAVDLEREKRDLHALRPLIRRQLADAHVAHARSLLRESGPEAQREFWTAAGNAAALLEGADLAPPDRFDTAVNVGSLLAARMGKREPSPGGGDAGDRGTKLIASVLPALEAAGRAESRREESLYLIALLRIISREEGAQASARSFLERFPESPLAADLAVRLGHEALASGDEKGAEQFYRAASSGGSREASAIARHMRGWIRHRNGDSPAALEELGPLIADPSFSCEVPGSFEKDVLSLSVRAMRESPPEDLSAFPPVREGTCGGRRLLLLLAESEAGRGDAARASEAYDALSRQYPGDESAPAFEKKAIEALVRAGRDREAMSRALSLHERYRPGSAWASSRPPSARESAATDLAGVLQTLSDRMFAEGIRTGDRSAMSLAAAGIERYYALSGLAPGGADGEMRLKWAIASLRTGERETAVSLLLELMGEGRNDDVGDRAAILYAETMIAGYERGEQDAEDAETAVYLLLGDDPPERSLALVLRAASDFLAAEEYERAGRVAEEIDADGSAPNILAAQVRLVRAESSYFRGETAAALRQAESLLGHPGAAASPELLLRAKELCLLAAHKTIQGRMAARDWHGAGEMLERVGERFADRQEAPLYYLNALRSYRQAGREDAVVRAGLRFLAEFPGREESMEVVGAVAPRLQARREFARAADLYEQAAESFPRNPRAPRFLFHAARLSEFAGDRGKALTRYSACRSRYAEPRWMSAYAALAIGSMKLAGGDAKTAVREMEEGVRLVKAGLEPDAPVELPEMAGRARIAIGENWAEQFRKAPLVLPLERSLAVKERFFRQALAAFEAAGIDSPLEVALQASRLSADLLLEFGKSILESQRPKGMGREEGAKYDEALKRRARDLFERAFARYAEAFDLLESEKGTPDLAVPIRDRLEEVQALLSKVSGAKEESP